MAKVGARGLKDDMTAKADIPPSTFTLDQARDFCRRQWPSLDEPSIDRLIQNSLTRAEETARPDGEPTPRPARPEAEPALSEPERVGRAEPPRPPYANRYDRRLADITTKAAI